MEADYIKIPFEEYERLKIIESRFSTIKGLVDIPVDKEEDEDEV